MSGCKAYACSLSDHVVHRSCTGKPSNNERQSGIPVQYMWACSSDNAFIAIHCLPKVRRGSCVYIQLDVLYVLSQLILLHRASGYSYSIDVWACFIIDC